MNKFLLLGAATAALICAGPAFADPSASNVVTINGSSPNTCTLGAPGSSGTTNASLSSSTATTSTVAITNLSDPTTAALNATAITLTFAGMCNYAHHVGIESANSGLQNASLSNDPVAGSGSFIKKVGYTAAWTWAGHSSSGAEGFAFTNDVGIGASASAADLKGTSVAVAGANQGNLVVNLSIAASATPVVAGSYSDSLTVQIGASL